MKRFVVPLLLLSSSLFWACQEAPRSVIAPVVTPPVVYYPPVTTTPTVKPSVPSGVDLYAQFAQPFASSATQRLKQINLYIDTLLVANSAFTYNSTGQVAMVAYLRYFGGEPYRNTVTYTYDSQGRLLREAFTEPINSGNGPEQVTTRQIDYTYTADKLSLAVEQSSIYFAFPSRLSVSARTRYGASVNGYDLITKIGYHNAVGGVNTAASVDSTRQLLSRTGNVVTRSDSLFDARTSMLINYTIRRKELDPKNNVLLLRTDERRFYQSGDQLTVTTSAYTYQYNGPDGLLSGSTNQTLGLRYAFVYESK
ncbi:hypothetical protein J2I47_01590 [Fibrella sp. HMF5335]|uniref:YD repeat-containing protein n=1 Tax=Fibrella rubiginis TaxID=2817060 RepID=A0A939K4B8_9BACT|nr:hypothetical protein [Fibrella rubiginis]MBO0935230.1 hypothetical protein [Fibrella rubiginis]